ncbi:hypothetical protein [Bacillus sp. FJAT-45350]|nr:hypothetical protein [Bacillus sp. FJAT-45350]
MEKKSINSEAIGVREALNGLLIGVIMMVALFLFIHFVLGFKAFS